MDSKKLAKVIKIIVEKELEKRLPKLIEEGINKVLTEEKTASHSNTDIELDAFDTANEILERSRDEEPVQKEVKRYSKNPVLNEILNNTKPFKDRGGSMLDRFESQQQSHPQQQPLEENFKEMDKTVSFDSNGAGAGIEAMREKMKAKMGYGGTPSAPEASGNSAGLGVKTGLPGLDRVLNRDNSELVKKFKTR